MLKIAVFGGLTIDSNEYGGKIYEKIGGSPYYISLILSKLDIETYVYSVVGHDFPRGYIKKLCSLSNINCILFRYGFPHIVFKNIYEDDESRVQYINGIIGKIPIEKVIDQVSKIDYLILSPVLNEINLDDVRKLDVSKMALDLQGFLRIVDGNKVNTGRYVPTKFLNGIDIIKFSVEDGYNIIYDEDYFHEILKASNRYLCLTLGKKGSLLFTKHGGWYVPVYPVKKSGDPTGSGDVFLGGFVYAVLSNMNPLESLSFASASTSLFIEGVDISKNMIIGRMQFLMDNAITLVERTYREFIIHCLQEPVCKDGDI